MTFVVLSSANPAISVRLPLDATPPAVTGGYGGWEMVARPRRAALTQWKGREPFTATIAFVLGSLVGDDPPSQEVSISRLERLALPNPNPGGEPPVVRARGTMPHSDLEWVIQIIEWGDSDRNRRGERIVQHGVVTLWRYTADDRIQLMPAAAEIRRKTAESERALAAKKGGKTASKKLYYAKSGDTLSSIAADQLGSHKRWKEIGDLNNIRDDKSVVEGQEIRLP